MAVQGERSVFNQTTATSRHRRPSGASAGTSGRCGGAIAIGEPANIQNNTNNKTLPRPRSELNNKKQKRYGINTVLFFSLNARFAMLLLLLATFFLFLPVVQALEQQEQQQQRPQHRVLHPDRQRLLDDVDKRSFVDTIEIELEEPCDTTTTMSSSSSSSMMMDNVHNNVDHRIPRIAQVTGCHDAERIFPFAGEKFEERHIAFGLHCHYRLSCTPSPSSSSTTTTATHTQEGWMAVQATLHLLDTMEREDPVYHGGIRSVHPSVQAEAVGQSDPAPFDQQQDKHDHSHHNSTATTQAAHQTLAAASQRRRRRRLLPRRGASVMTNDPRLSEQAQDYSAINLFEAWEIMNQFSAWGNASKEVIVHVLDAGLDHLNHNDLGNNLWQNPGEICNDNIDNDGNGLIDDCHGWNHANNNHVLIGDIDHGTHVGGTCIYDLI